MPSAKPRGLHGHDDDDLRVDNLIYNSLLGNNTSISITTTTTITLQSKVSTFLCGGKAVCRFRLWMPFAKP